MNEINFKSEFGTAKTFEYELDGEQFEVLIAPIIPFDQRTMMINDMLDMMTVDGKYQPAYKNFAIDYNLLIYYTDVRFDSAEDNKISADECSNIYEFIKRTGIIYDIIDTIYDYNDIIAEVNDAVDMLKNKSDSPWNDIGDKISVLLDDILNSFDNIGSVEELQTVLQSMTGMFAAPAEKEEE